MIAYLFCSLALVIIPVSAVTFINCGQSATGLAIYIFCTLLLLAVLTPIVGAALLLVLKRQFSEFYKEIWVQTVALIII